MKFARLGRAFGPWLGILAAALTVFAAVVGGSSSQKARFRVLHAVDVDQPGGAPFDIVKTRSGEIYGASVSADQSSGSVIFHLKNGSDYEVVHRFPPFFAVRSMIQTSDGSLFGDGGYTNGADRKQEYFRAQPGPETAVRMIAAPKGMVPGTMIPDGSPGDFTGFVTTGYQEFSLVRIQASGAVEVIHRFQNSEGIPYAGASITRTSDGDYYGLAIEKPFGISPGWLYRIQKDGSYSKLSEIPRFPTGGLSATVLAASDGYLYITMAEGGPHNKGSILRADRTGKLETFVDFPDGKLARPVFLMQGTDGKLYGSNDNLPSYIFSVHPGTRALNEIYALNEEGQEGQCPCRMIDGGDGRLYGTAIGGGRAGKGVVFAIDLAAPSAPVKRP